ncbi:DegT/DnrJ/EryC1/StrS family aminotransferase [Candidatus Pelagibacter bacterium nBUS_30]|uniref:DegT/DnrJ/EryC1/StrS family aminotransferase n=1 Tax=Candidatus Pelagibacter bacterium nBUS_30 TaxID=3374191 RepID=UPI003EBE5A2D
MKTIKRVDLAKQWKKEKFNLLPLIIKTLESGEYVGSKTINILEKNIANYCGTRFAVCTNSGTDSLTLALFLLGVKKGDEVITAPNSFIASAATIAHLGAKPVFADVKDDQLIDPKEIEKKITKKTKAIMVVHLSGRIADMKSIKLISKKFKIPIIEDAAQAIGSKYYGKKSGSLSEIGCFSAHPLKNLNACGDSGFVTTNDAKYHKKLKTLINHGLEDRNMSKTFAYVSRMDALQATILNYRLKNLDHKIKQRRKVASLYFKKLRDLPIKLPYENKGEYNSYHLFVIQLKKRNELQKYLMKNNIETGVHYPIPIHLQKASKYLNYKIGSFPITEKQTKTILSLPINENLTISQINYICKKIREFFNEK